MAHTYIAWESEFTGAQAPEPRMRTIKTSFQQQLQELDDRVDVRSEGLSFGDAFEVRTSETCERSTQTLNTSGPLCAGQLVLYIRRAINVPYMFISLHVLCNRAYARMLTKTPRLTGGTAACVHGMLAA